MFNQSEPELPQLPNRKVLYLIFDKQRLKASSNLVTQNSELHLNTADRPLQLHEKEESSAYPSVGNKRLLFSLGEGERSCWKKAYKLKKTGWSAPQPSSRKVWSSPDSSSTSYSKTRRVLPQLFRGSRRALLSSRELLCLLVSRLSNMRRLKRPHS